MTDNTIDVSIHIFDPNLTDAFPYPRSLHDRVSKFEAFAFPSLIEWCEKRDLEIVCDDVYLRASEDQIVGFALSTEEGAIRQSMLSGMFWTPADIAAFRTSWPSLFLVRYDLPM